MQREKLRKQKGITLIALIITIIVMLILVGVTVTVALNGGLFSTAKNAAGKTEEAKQKEQQLANGEVNVDGLIYTSMEEYINNNPKLAEGWRVATDEERTTAWPTETVKNENVKAITDGTNTVPLPQGFQVSLEDGESTVSTGLVITDGENEFVWIPYTDTYTEDNLGPAQGTHRKTTFKYDSQNELDYYYGTGCYNFERDFDYATDKTNIEASINKYDGFYVGRYETTIDENGKIGSKRNTPVLTKATILKEGINTKDHNRPFYYRWWGLYKAQKDMYAENKAISSTMITSKHWDAIMKFTEYSSGTRGKETYTTKPDLSGSAYSTNKTEFDVAKNIYDLAGNVYECTMKLYEMDGDCHRVLRGGYYGGRYS